MLQALSNACSLRRLAIGQSVALGLCHSAIDLTLRFSAESHATQKILLPIFCSLGSPYIPSQRTNRPRQLLTQDTNPYKNSLIHFVITQHYTELYPSTYG